MSFFQIQNAYSEKINDDLNSKSEFEINSDVFDTELLKFQQNLKNAMQSDKHNDYLADHNHEVIREILFSLFCSLFSFLFFSHFSASQKCQSVTAD